MDDNNLYSDDNFTTEASPIGYIEMMTRMERRLDEALRDSKRNHKRKKKGGKSKKYKKRLKAVEKQNEKIIEFLRIMASQTQTPPPSPWWKGTLENSAPKLIDLASTVIKSKHQPVVQVLPANNQSPLYLTDGRDRK